MFHLEERGWWMLQDGTRWLRTPQRCSRCGTILPPGETATYQVYVTYPEREFIYGYRCLLRCW